MFFTNKYKKDLKEIEGKYEYHHSLLSGEIQQNISKIDSISRTNLLYCDIHTSYFKRYKEIRDDYDSLVHDIIEQLKEYLYSNRFKEFKAYKKENAQFINNYCDLTDKLSNDLLDILKPEEEARQTILELKENFREVKSTFNNKEMELSYLSNSFQSVFDKIEANFDKYESLLESASYDDAKEIVTEIEKVLPALIKIINKTPDYLNEVLNILPNEIDDITKQYKELILKGLSLKTFDIEGALSEIKSEIEDVKNSLRSLSINKVERKIVNIHNELDDIKSKFVEEEESKNKFEQNINSVSSNFLNLEKEYVKISSQIEKIEKIYIVDDVHKNEYLSIKSKLDEVSKDKRKLETYVNSIETTPYKILYGKMSDLSNGTKDLETKINSFNAYIHSLKSDAEKVFSLINGLYLKIKKYESFIRDFNNDDFYNKFKNKFASVYKTMDDISAIINKTPIDVSKINLLSNDLTTNSNLLFKEIDELLHYKELATETILEGNLNRTKFADVNALLEQAESFYDDFEFKKAYETSFNAIEKINHRNGLN